MKQLTFLAALLFGIALFGVSLYFGLKLQETDTTAEFWSQYQPGGENQAPHEAFGKFVLESIPQAYAYLPQKESRYGYKWDDLRLHYVPRLHSTKDTNEYLFLLDEFFSLLDDNQTQVLHPPLPLDRSLPVSVTRDGDRLRITGFSPEIARAYPALQPGAYLTAVDGLPVGSLWAELKKASGYGVAGEGDLLLAPRFFQSYYFYKLRDTAPAAARLTVTDTTGAGQDLTLAWRQSQDLQVRTGSSQGISAKKLGDGSAGYVKVDTLDPQQAGTGAIEQAFATVAGAKGLILDLRSSAISDAGSAGQAILSHLVGSEATALTKEFRYSTHLHLFGQSVSDYPGKPLLSFKDYSQPIIKRVAPAAQNSFAGKPILLLVDERSFGSAGTLIAAFKDLNLGRIVGRGGLLHSGQSLKISYPYQEGWGLSVGTVVTRGPGGAISESRSLKPDLEVPLTRSEILGETDPILEAALNALK